MSSYITLIECEDAKGLIHKITGVLFEEGCNIEVQNEFVDKKADRFFLRTEVSCSVDPEVVQAKLEKVLPKGSNVRFFEERKKKIAVFVTVESHCLGDLLIRHDFGELLADVSLVISNHDKLRGLVEKFNIPFYCVSHVGRTREEHEAMILQILEKNPVDYLVLAKYMRILSKSFVERFPNRIVNIHHSFLPAFVGANPYRQAFERGVKIIGATAHFVTESLDEGPIISQGISRVSHGKTIRDIMQQGRNIEKLVLAEAVRLVFSERVFVNQNRTIIFD